MPREVYYEGWSGCVLVSRPEAEEIETGETDEDGEPITEWSEPEPCTEVDLWTHILGRELSSHII